MRWTNSFIGRKARKEAEQARLVQREAERIATEGVMEALTHDKKLRRAFRGIITRAQAERLSMSPHLTKREKAERERQLNEDRLYGTGPDHD